jgi:hypothetical protein
VSVIVRGARPRLIGQAFQPAGDKARPPLADRHAQLRGDPFVVAPVAQASTIRHRRANAWELLARRDQRPSVARSSSVKTNGAFGRPVLAIG